MTFRRALAAVQMSAVRITFQRKALNDDRLGDANLNEPCLAKKNVSGFEVWKIFACKYERVGVRTTLMPLAYVTMLYLSMEGAPSIMLE